MEKEPILIRLYSKENQNTSILTKRALTDDEINKLYCEISKQKTKSILQYIYHQEYEEATRVSKSLTKLTKDFQLTEKRNRKNEQKNLELEVVLWDFVSNHICNLVLDTADWVQYKYETCNIRP